MKRNKNKREKKTSVADFCVLAYLYVCFARGISRQSFYSEIKNASAKICFIYNVEMSFRKAILNNAKAREKSEDDEMKGTRKREKERERQTTILLHLVCCCCWAMLIVGVHIVQIQLRTILQRLIRIFGVFGYYQNLATE